MIREVTGDDINIGGDWYHPVAGSISKTEAQKKAQSIRKKTGLNVRVLHRESGVHCLLKEYKVRIGGPGWVPFRGWVIYRVEKSTKPPMKPLKKRGFLNTDW